MYLVYMLLIVSFFHTSVCELLHIHNITKTNFTYPPIFVVTNRPSRFDDFMTRFNSCEIPLPNDVILCNSVMTQTNRDSIVVDEYLRNGRLNTSMSRSILGVTLINDIIYQFIVKNNIKVAIMMEDDINYNCIQKEYLQDLVTQFVNSSHDIAYFGSREIPVIGTQQTEDFYDVGFNYPLYGHPHGWCSTFGYIVKLSAARDILQNMYPINVPIDVYIANRVYVHAIKALVVSPDKLLKEIDDNIHDTWIT